MSEGKTLPTVQEIMAQIPQCTSLLYDLDLLPEQWDGEHDEYRANLIANHLWATAEAATRELRENLEQLTAQLAEKEAALREIAEIYERIQDTRTTIEHAGRIAYDMRCMARTALAPKEEG
jgi:hypothetical protein